MRRYWKQALSKRSTSILQGFLLTHQYNHNMETLAWRYHPEFTVQLLINGQDADDSIRLSPAPSDAGIFDRYGLLAKNISGQVTVFVKQRHDGIAWIPVASLSQALVLAFWLEAYHAAAWIPDFYRQGKQRFGKKILYANNVSGTGVIDANVNANTVTLSAPAAAGNTENGALSPFLLTAAI